MAKPFVPVGVFDYRKRYLFTAESIKEAAERTGLKYVTIQKASHSRSHRCMNRYYIVPIEEIGK